MASRATARMQPEIILFQSSRSTTGWDADVRDSGIEPFCLPPSMDVVKTVSGDVHRDDKDHQQDTGCDEYFEPARNASRVGSSIAPDALSASVLPAMLAAES